MFPVRSDRQFFGPAAGLTTKSHNFIHFLLDAKCHIVVTDVAPDTKANIAGNCNIFFVLMNKNFSVITFIFDPSQGGGFSF